MYNVGPDLDPNCLTLCVTGRILRKKLNLEKNQSKTSPYFLKLLPKTEG